MTGQSLKSASNNMFTPLKMYSLHRQSHPVWQELLDTTLEFVRDLGSRHCGRHVATTTPAPYPFIFLKAQTGWDSSCPFSCSNSVPATHNRIPARDSRTPAAHFPAAIRFQPRTAGFQPPNGIRVDCQRVFFLQSKRHIFRNLKMCSGSLSPCAPQVAITTVLNCKRLQSLVG